MLSDREMTDPANRGRAVTADGLTDDGQPGPDRRGSAEVTRSEEQLQVTTRRVPVRRARLERVQITEMITVEVPVIREDVRIVYDTIDDHTPGDQPSTEQPRPPRPWVLCGERIVISKEWVPLETVQLEVETVTEQQQVTDDVRKEQVSVDSPPLDSALTSAADREPTAMPPASPAPSS